MLDVIAASGILISTVALTLSFTALIMLVRGCPECQKHREYEAYQALIISRLKNKGLFGRRSDSDGDPVTDPSPMENEL